jgi:transcription antitermination factor NusG
MTMAAGANPTNGLSAKELEELGIIPLDQRGLSLAGPRAEARAHAVSEASRRKLYAQQAYPYKGWHAFVAVAGREQDAADGFRRERVRAYWPNEVKLAPSGHSRRRLKCSAIIPGLIFTPLADLDLLWEAVERIQYVLNVVRKEDGAPAIVANEDIEIIRRIEAGLNLPPPVTPFHNFNLGDKVRFIDDILGRWPVLKITGLSKDGRISVEGYLMGRMVPIRSVLPHQIERVS